MAGIMQIKIEQLKVTSPFIKIGAKVLNHVKATSLEDLKKYFNEAPNVGVKVGGLCIAALSPGKFNQQPKYERCRLIHIDDDKMATVWFLDCNYQGVVHCKQVRPCPNALCFYTVDFPSVADPLRLIPPRSKPVLQRIHPRRNQNGAKQHIQRKGSCPARSSYREDV